MLVVSGPQFCNPKSSEKPKSCKFIIKTSLTVNSGVTEGARVADALPFPTSRPQHSGPEMISKPLVELLLGPRRRAAMEPEC